MTVHYPDDLVLTEAQHLALRHQDADPNGTHWETKGKPQAQAFHDANVAEAEAAAEAMEAEEKPTKSAKK